MPDSQLNVRVNLAERSYDIAIGSGKLATAGEFVTSCCQASHVVVITDKNVESLHAASAIDSLVSAGLRVDQIVLEPGEATKSVLQADELWRVLLEFGTDRKSVVAAVGGGVVGDLAGFIAATYARGISFVQLPTTLLAQVDSSVGGKVGVNLPGAKNMVGGFWQPHGVLIDIDALLTLPVRDYRSGLGEVVKYGVILDESFFEFLESNVDAINARQTDILGKIVARCCQLKADVVQADEREETGIRAVLNYGHTYCHALETVTGYGTFLHGEAVAIGMLCASRLAESLGRIDHEATRRQHDLLLALGLPVTVPDLDRQMLLDAMQHDKKTVGGQLRFVLPSRIGHVELIDDVPSDKARAAFDG
ncbi:MAG: 3-dehydroquinate synthase [Pirellulaceae bacterium]|jgi:3-dehydroquinate synthase|nr:3-dehydroquinate synthase [Pirellulaceae bacterium]HJN11936.1 3-dehydroquinate synthase [Pirellulaceae bacterium]